MTQKQMRGLRSRRMNVSPLSMFGFVLMIAFVVTTIVYFFSDTSEYPWLPYFVLLLFVSFLYVRYLELAPHLSTLTAQAKDSLKKSGINADMLDTTTEANQAKGRLKGKARKAQQNKMEAAAAAAAAASS
jgi:hypothetical protein